MHHLLPQPVVVLPNLVGGDRQEPTTDHHDPDVIVIDGPPSSTEITVRVDNGDRQIPFVNRTSKHQVSGWDLYIGQEAVKAEMRVMIDDALARMAPLPHAMFASGLPGVGKTTLAEVCSDELGGHLYRMSPPFSRSTLHEALLSMSDYDILFIDEIHRMAGNGMDEDLLTVMEEGKIYLDDGVHVIADITVIGATTQPGKLDRAVRSRFMITPHFERYTIAELVRIVETNFEAKMIVGEGMQPLTPEVRLAIAKACRWTPRVARELVLGARALINSKGRMITPQELLAFKRTEPDGTTRAHIQYVTTLFTIGRNVKADDEVEYRAGEATMLMALDQDRDGLAEIERWLIEIGLVHKTPRGRALTQKGAEMAQYWLLRGERLPK